MTWNNGKNIKVGAIILRTAKYLALCFHEKVYERNWSDVENKKYYNQRFLKPSVMMPVLTEDSIAMIVYEELSNFQKWISIKINSKTF